MNNEEKLREILARIGADHVKLTKQQEEYAIKEVGRVRAEMAELLADYADKDGIIARTRIAALMKELDAIEKNLREHGTLAIDEAINKSSEWTTKKVNGALENIVGASITSSTFDTVNREVFRYVTKRFGSDGLVLSDRIWDVSDNIRSQISMVIRSGIIRGEGMNTIIAKVRKAYENETWKIRRLVQTEASMAYRTAVALNASKSDVVTHVKIHAGRKKSRACTSLANADLYGLGRGVYLPTDSQIYNPHPNCTSWISYVLDERYL